MGAAIDELCFVTAFDGRVLWVSQSVQRHTGYTIAEFQVSPRDNPIVHPDDAARVGEAIERFAASGLERSAPYENRVYDRWGVERTYRTEILRTQACGEPALLFVCRPRPDEPTAGAEIEVSFRALVEQAHDPILRLAADGKFLYFSPQFPLLLGRTPMELAGKGLADFAVDPDAVREALARGGSFSLEIFDKSGGHHLCEASISPLGDGQIIAVVRDVSAARRREDELRQAQKMEAIGRLAGGVAHDFNNMLGVIRTYVDLLTRQRKADTKLVDDLAQIGLATERAARLTSQLLAFSRRQVLAPTVVDLGDIAQNMATMLRQLIGPDIELRVNARACGAVRADRGQLEQVVLNLVVNSRDAMPRGGAIDIDVTEVALPEGAFARLSVVDQGTGMTDVEVTRAAEPFFTTRMKGTGLGLSTVHGIVHQSGGHLALDSKPGTGTRVDVFLPIVEGTSKREPQSAAPVLTASRPAVILLVEDERLVRESVHRLLEDLGYTVVAAESPGEALGHCRESDDAIDLMLTDFAMPGMNGLELSTKIRKLRPTCRILMMSGYAASSDSAAAAGVMFLPKPFSVDALAEAVRSALDG
ncbi:MAG: response regulator [Kofleriaceae bacterium]|nr:response regulator [Kofleriaceae bacterium]